MSFTEAQWTKMMMTFPPGTSVSGLVMSSQIFGVFVRLDELPDVKALLELIHFESNEADAPRRLQFPDDYPRVGSRIRARILAWSLHPHDVRLTQLSHLSWTSHSTLTKEE